MAFAHRSHFLSRFELHRDRVSFKIEVLVQLLTNRCSKILKLGALENHRRIHVHDGIANFGGQISSVLQKLQAIGALPARVSIGKVHPDVPQGGRSQQCVRDGMRKYVGIGVSFQAELGRNRYAAQNQRPAGHDAMNVPTLAHPKVPGYQIAQDDSRMAISSARNSLARSMSESLVILIFRSLPGTTLTST